MASALRPPRPTPCRLIPLIRTCASGKPPLDPDIKFSSVFPRSTKSDTMALVIDYEALYAQARAELEAQREQVLDTEGIRGLRCEYERLRKALVVIHSLLQSAEAAQFADAVHKRTQELVHERQEEVARLLERRAREETHALHERVTQLDGDHLDAYDVVMTALATTAQLPPPAASAEAAPAAPAEATPAAPAEAAPVPDGDESEYEGEDITTWKPPADEEQLVRGSRRGASGVKATPCDDPPAVQVAQLGPSCLFDASGCVKRSRSNSVSSDASSTAASTTSAGSAAKPCICCNGPRDSVKTKCNACRSVKGKHGCEGCASSAEERRRKAAEDAARKRRKPDGQASDQD